MNKKLYRKYDGHIYDIVYGSWGGVDVFWENLNTIEMLNTDTLGILDMPYNSTVAEMHFNFNIHDIYSVFLRGEEWRSSMAYDSNGSKYSPYNDGVVMPYLNVIISIGDVFK